MGQSICQKQFGKQWQTSQEADAGTAGEGALQLVSHWRRQDSLKNNAPNPQNGNKPQIATSNSYKATYIPQTAQSRILSSVSSFLGTMNSSRWASTLSQENAPPFFQPWEFLISVFGQWKILHRLLPVQVSIKRASKGLVPPI